MEQLLAFILGAGTGLIIWGVVVAFRTAKQVKLLQVNITDIYQVINQNDAMVNRRVDQEINRTDSAVSNIYSAMDSRFDKLEAKITKEKQLIKG
jgi:hypothetical protein